MKGILTLFIFMTATNSFAKDNGEERYLQVISNKNPLFKSAMNVAGVREMYSECYKLDAQDGKLEDGNNNLSECLWNRIQADQGVKDKVMDLVNKQSGDKGSGRYRTTMETTKKQSAGLKALKKFFQERLEQALYGEYKSDKQRFEKIANQRTFFELYKTQLGKNIIAAMTSYCIDSSAYPVANDSKGRARKSIPLINADPQQAENERKANLQSLNNFNGEKIEASGQWELCIGSISKVCTIGNSSSPNTYEILDPTTGEIAEELSYNDALKACTDRQPANISKTKAETSCEETINNSNSRACKVVQYIELAKQSILATDKIVEAMDKKPAVQGATDNIEIYNSSKNSKESIDALTTISSGQALEALSDGHQEEVAEMEKCFKDNQVVDPEACKQYLATDKEEQYALLGELKIQQEATLEKLDSIENTPEEIAKLLEEEGYTEEQAKELATVANVKEQIRNRYESKKEAILESLRKEIEAHTTTGDEFDAAIDKDKIENIANEINSRPENFSKLVHYNNIVSSFLKVTSTDKEGNEVKTMNTAALSAEMKESFLSEENREKYKEMGVDLSSLGYSQEQLGQKFAEAGVDYSEATSDDAVLNIGDINSYILNIFSNDTQEENSRGTSSN